MRLVDGRAQQQTRSPSDIRVLVERAVKLRRRRRGEKSEGRQGKKQQRKDEIITSVLIFRKDRQILSLLACYTRVDPYTETEGQKRHAGVYISTRALLRCLMWKRRAKIAEGRGRGRGRGGGRARGLPVRVEWNGEISARRTTS